MTKARGTLDTPDGQLDLGELKLELTCPCGETVTVFETTVLHRMPMCADFNERDSVNYLRWLRKRAEKRKRSEGSS